MRLVMHAGPQLIRFVVIVDSRGQLPDAPNLTSYVVDQYLKELDIVRLGVSSTSPRSSAHHLPVLATDLTFLLRHRSADPLQPNMIRPPHCETYCKSGNFRYTGDVAPPESRHGRVEPNGSQDMLIRADGIHAGTHRSVDGYERHSRCSVSGFGDQPLYHMLHSPAGISSGYPSTQSCRFQQWPQDCFPQVANILAQHVEAMPGWLGHNGGTGTPADTIPTSLQPAGCLDQPLYPIPGFEECDTVVESIEQGDWSSAMGGQSSATNGNPGLCGISSTGHSTRDSACFIDTISPTMVLRHDHAEGISYSGNAIAYPEQLADLTNTFIPQDPVVFDLDQTSGRAYSARPTAIKDSVSPLTVPADGSKQPTGLGSSEPFGEPGQSLSASESQPEDRLSSSISTMNAFVLQGASEDADGSFGPHNDIETITELLGPRAAVIARTYVERIIDMSSERPKYRCKMKWCGKRFQTTRTCIRHWREKHWPHRPFRCRRCSKAFKRSDHVLRHLRACRKRLPVGQHLNP